MLRLSSVCWIVIAIALFGGARAFDGVGDRDASENAALWYWRCFNELQVDADSSKRYIAILRGETQPNNDQELETLRERWTRVVATAEVAAAKPYCLFAIDREEGLNALLPHLEPMRRLAKMISAEAGAAIEQGDTQTAARLIGTLCAMAGHTAQDGIHISMLVAASICRMAFERVEELVDEGAVDNALAEKLRSSLAATRSIAPSSFAAVLTVERAMTSQIMLQWWDGPEDVDDAKRFFERFGAEPINLLSAEELVRDLQRFDAHFADLIAAAETNDYERFDALTAEANTLKHGIVAALMMAPYRNGLSELRKLDAERTLLMARLERPLAASQPADAALNSREQ